MPSRRLAAGSLSVFVTLLGFVGCGGSTQPGVVPAGEAGPHGARVHPIPGDRGFVEIRTELTGQGMEPALAAYFLQADRKTPLNPLPTNVSASIVVPDTTATEALTPTPNPADPASAGRFITKTSGLFFNVDVKGQLTGTLAGQPFTVDFNFE